MYVFAACSHQIFNALDVNVTKIYVGVLKIIIIVKYNVTQLVFMK